MKKQKIKTYVVLLSERFLKGHPKAGQPTYFKQKFENALYKYPYSTITRYDGDGNKQPDILIDNKKIHTIRNNYPLWEKRINEVLQGKAIISLRVWEDKPYRSKQRIIKDLTVSDGVGIQLLDCDKPFAWEIDEKGLDKSIMSTLANNDGLSYEDFDSWFDIENARGQKAIIHFTNFRY